MFVLAVRTETNYHIKFYSWALYSSLQNIVAPYSFGSVMCNEEKTIEYCENQNNCKGV
jgi:hypothetical protein